MLDGRVRRLSRLATLVALAIGCAPVAGPAPARDALADAAAFEDDVAARRAALEASVSVADTPYATLRLDHYATGAEGDWDALPVFAPRVRRMRVRGGTASDESLEEGPVIADAPLDDLAGYEAAGARAFERYPAQIDLALARLRDRATAERLGFVVEADGIVRGLVEVQTSTGWNVALSCR